MQALKDKERKKQEEAEQKVMNFEERSQKKNLREEEMCHKKEEIVRKKAEGEAAMVEKEVAKTKRETVNLQVREKTEGKTLSELCCIHRLMLCLFWKLSGGYRNRKAMATVQCQRWVHEDCIDYDDSSDTFCPFC